MSDYLPLVGVVLAVAAIVAVLFRIAKGRCPACGKLFAGRVTGSEQTASVVTSDFGYDQQRDEYRNIRTRQTGYLIKRQCRFCDHTWERMESTSRKLDRLTDAQAEEYRRRKLF